MDEEVARTIWMLVAVMVMLIVLLYVLRERIASLFPS